MTMTSKSQPTREDLEQQLLDATEAAAALERKIAAISADGKSAKAAMQQLADAHADETRLRLAVEEAGRREAEAQAKESEAQAKARRIAAYGYIADLEQRKREVLDALAAVRVAEGHVADLGPSRAIPRDPQTSGDLDYALLRDFSGFPRGDRDREVFRERGDAGRCQRVINRARLLIAAEEEGTADEVTMSFEQWNQDRRERREQQRREYEEATPPQYRGLSHEQRKKREAQERREEREAQAPKIRKAVV